MAYESTARRFLLRAKSGGEPVLFTDLAVLLAVALRGSRAVEERAVVVPVPSHPWARLRRGFDPALLLAAPVAAALGLPLRPRAIARRWRTAAAVKGLGAAARRSALRGAFRIRDRFPEGPILVVDDVATTGSTLAACAEALSGAGAREVHAAVWARTPERRYNPSFVPGHPDRR